MQQRSLKLNDMPVQKGHNVVYLMSRDQRAHDNHALLIAQQAALEHKLPLVVMFHVFPRFGVRSREHYQFMISGLKKLEQELKLYNISFVLSQGNTDALNQQLTDLKPAAIYADFSPLKGPRRLQKDLAAQYNVPFNVVDTHNLIPLWITSDKQEYAAHTIRRKIHKSLKQWLTEPAQLQIHTYSPHGIPLNDWSQVDSLVESTPAAGIKVDFEPGETVALRTLHDFIETKLDDYAIDRNDPNKHATTNLSPYLHFGMISSLRIALELTKVSTEPPLLLREARLAQPGTTSPTMDGINALLEELIIRKELAENYCFYTEHYDNLAGAWPWATSTLKTHESDPRDFIYTLDQLETANTHDSAWNAAQNQMRHTGKLHGYMRMYWAKKILEWTSSPDEAVKIAIYLNDHYSIDGGDPNGYTGIMWSIAGVHDRPWFDRPVFGTIRYMNSAGLARKFDLPAYIKRWADA